MSKESGVRNGGAPGKLKGLPRGIGVKGSTVGGMAGPRGTPKVGKGFPTNPTAAAAEGARRAKQVPAKTD